MTRRRILALLISFTAIGGAIVTVCVVDLIQEPGAKSLVSAASILIAVWVVAVMYVQAIRELRRRPKG
jgi:hypothetical protein